MHRNAERGPSGHHTWTEDEISAFEAHHAVGSKERLALALGGDVVRIATPIGHLTLLTTRSGRSYSANNFSDQFRVWCDEAGLPQRCVFHGLRKAAARRLAEGGCTANEIAALTGHASLREVERYTKAADQMRMARSAMAKTAAREQTGTESVKPDPVEVSKPLKALAKN
jgi:integrase